MSLRVGIDAWNLPHDRRGIGRYVREIANAWIRLGPEAVRVELIIPERPAWLASRRYVHEIAGAVPVRSRGRERGLDVVWFPWNGMSWDPAVAAVATLHDASLFRTPPQDPQIAEREHRPFRTAASHARRVITDSEFSKEELVQFLALEPKRIEVIPLGVSAAFRAEPLGRAERDQYVLFVGDAETRKGLTTVVEALERLPATLRDSLELKIVGGAEATAAAPHGRTRVTRLGWVDDAALAALYRRALALVYPSNYEGYGLPIIEAMACGTPAIVADTRSSREAGGSAAIYFPVDDASALASAIGAIAAAPRSAFEEIVAAGRAHAGGRTWEETARKTLAVLAKDD